MKQPGKNVYSLIGVCAAACGFGLCKFAAAAGVLYADPGWYHAYEGNSAYYHDPDGPNPDYSAPSGPDDGNQPGGQSDQPALINPGGCPADCSALAIWQNKANQWDGSAPGPPVSTPGPSPVPPPAPGGVGVLTEGSTTFIRIQDPGNPISWGWSDKGDVGFVGGPRQEGNNRKIEFKHEMNRDAAFTSQRQDILDFGVTISFRTRIATVATGPLDDLYPESGGTTPPPWPTDGIGYPIGANRGIFMITQTGVDGPGQLSFGLLDSNTIATLSNGAEITKTGLVMNNQSNGSPGSPVDTESATAATLNVEQIDNNLLTSWHEFWITAKHFTTPINGNTHEVTVYKDGSLTPDVFKVVLAGQNEFGIGSHLGLGMTSGTRFGAGRCRLFRLQGRSVCPDTRGSCG